MSLFDLHWVAFAESAIQQILTITQCCSVVTHNIKTPHFYSLLCSSTAAKFCSVPKLYDNILTDFWAPCTTENSLEFSRNNNNSHIMCTGGSNKTKKFMDSANNFRSSSSVRKEIKGVKLKLYLLRPVLN